MSPLASRDQDTPQNSYKCVYVKHRVCTLYAGTCMCNIDTENMCTAGLILLKGWGGGGGGGGGQMSGAKNLGIILQGGASQFSRVGGEGKSIPRGPPEINLAQ